MDTTAQTEPLTAGQRLVADYERDMISEPCDLAAAIDAELARPREALSVLRAAGDQFAFYAKEHRAKGTPEADAKAATNEAWAQRCFAACKAAGGEG